MQTGVDNKQQQVANDPEVRVSGNRTIQAAAEQSRGITDSIVGHRSCAKVAARKKGEEEIGFPLGELQRTGEFVVEEQIRR